MKREIIMFGSQVLRKPCLPVKEVDDDIRALVGDLFDSMGSLHRKLACSNASVSSTSPTNNPNTRP
jgi:peptide deformylase